MAPAPRVLLVDDDPGLLRLLTLRLEAAGYRVDSCASGEEALARLKVKRPRAVVTDLRMPGIDGMTLFHQIHHQDPTLPVIILTAHGSIPDAVEATRHGVYGYLTKPIEAPALLALLERAMKMVNVQAGAHETEGERWRRDIVTASPRMEALLSEARLVAQADASVLIQGESGTGKEVLAHAIHRASPRRDGAFVAVNCAAIPQELLESELFGHAKGAFTGAVRSHVGLFRQASGGTLFLDEIGDMPMALQPKLLRVLQEREVRPVGAARAEPIDVRVISATHRDLEAALDHGDFREDLYYRLNVVCLTLPPLRDRREDIPLLARRFLADQGQQQPAPAVTGFSPEALDLMLNYEWPGNIRQLLNLVEQCRALSTSPVIAPSLVGRALRDRPTEFPSLQTAKGGFEREYLVELLKLTRGRVAAAARIAGRNRTEFYRLLKRHGLSPDLFKAKG